MLGSRVLAPTDAELEMRDVARKSIVTLKPIAIGETLSLENVGLRRPGTGMPPERFDEVLGMRAIRDLPPDHLLAIEDLA